MSPAVALYSKDATRTAGETRALRHKVASTGLQDTMEEAGLEMNLAGTPEHRAAAGFRRPLSPREARARNVPSPY